MKLFHLQNEPNGKTEAWEFQTWCRINEDTKIRDRFQAVDSAGRPHFFRMNVVLPRDCWLKKQPIPEYAPTKIERIFLIHAPFYIASESWNSYCLETWEQVFYQTHNGKRFEFLPEDETALRRTLANFKRHWKKLRNAEKREIMRISDRTLREEKMANLAYRFDLRRRSTSMNGEQMDEVGLLRRTTDDIKQPKDEVFEAFMLAEWCKYTGQSIEGYNDEQERFKTTFKTYALNQKGTMLNFKTGERSLYSELRMYDEFWQNVMACVKFRVTFEDSSVAYLTDLAIKPPSTPEEIEETQWAKENGLIPKHKLKLLTNEAYTEFIDTSGTLPIERFNKGSMPFIIKTLHAHAIKTLGKPMNGWMHWGTLRSLTGDRTGAELSQMSPAKLFNAHAAFFQAVLQVDRKSGMPQDDDDVRIRIQEHVSIEVSKEEQRLPKRRGRKPKVRS